MPYKTSQELPESVRDRLTEPAQLLYLTAFNSALQWYGEEEKAHQAAWRAIKSQAANLNNALNG